MLWTLSKPRYDYGQNVVLILKKKWRQKKTEEVKLQKILDGAVITGRLGRLDCTSKTIQWEMNQIRPIEKINRPECRGDDVAFFKLKKKVYFCYLIDKFGNTEAFFPRILRQKWTCLVHPSSIHTHKEARLAPRLHATSYNQHLLIWLKIQHIQKKITNQMRYFLGVWVC